MIRFRRNGRFEDVLERIGKTPLPPYIKRSDGTLEQDRTRYQTVYAKERGSIAAPTAGLHFTDDVIAGIKARGVEIIEITLHVGYGTFEPVRVDDISEHRVSPENYEIERKISEIIGSSGSQNIAGSLPSELLQPERSRAVLPKRPVCCGSRDRRSDHHTGLRIQSC